jgi:hypothetical protein
MLPHSCDMVAQTRLLTVLIPAVPSTSPSFLGELGITVNGLRMIYQIEMDANVEERVAVR